jgi:hypothetical protein
MPVSNRIANHEAFSTSHVLVSHGSKFHLEPSEMACTKQQPTLIFLNLFLRLTKSVKMMAVPTQASTSLLTHHNDSS